MGKAISIKKNKAAIDNYIENSNKSAFSKGWKAITRIPKAVTTAIHGHAFPGTHYPMGFLTPQDWTFLSANLSDSTVLLNSCIIL